MKIERFGRRIKWTHAREHPHRAIQIKGNMHWTYAGHAVLLVQKVPRGPWFISPVPGNSRLEDKFDHEYGGKPLREWIVRLEMGI